MVYFCPQCGTKIVQGTSVCPSCGAALRYVLQKNVENNTVASEVMGGTKRKDSMFGQTMEFSMESIQEAIPSLKFNRDYVNPNETPINSESDMSIIGWVDELPDAAAESANQELVENEKINISPSAAVQTMVPESSKYKIITQVFDRKLGFNAAELETKLNMYAKLGYTIVPNTMICQPGQDFFVMLERTAMPEKKEERPAKSKKSAKEAKPEKQEEAPKAEDASEE